MMRSLYNGVAGVKTHGYGMDLLANNISNINTVGYKAAVPEFKDIFYQTTFEAGVNLGANQVGLAASGLSSAFSQKQGNLEITDRPLDMAIEGRGFFAIKDADGATYFTRNGDFGLDQSSHLSDNFGRYVLGTMNESFKAAAMSADIAKAYGNNIGTQMGYIADERKDIELAAEDKQEKIFLPPNLFNPPAATTYVNIKANLNATSSQKLTNTPLSDLELSGDDEAGYILSAKGLSEGEKVIFSFSKGKGKEQLEAFADKDGIASIKFDKKIDDNYSAILVKKEPVSAPNVFRQKIIAASGEAQTLEMRLSARIVPNQRAGLSYDAAIKLLDKEGKEIASQDGEILFNSDGSLKSSSIDSIAGIKLNLGSGIDKGEDATLGGGFDGLTSVLSLDAGVKNIEANGHEAGVLKAYSVDIKGNILASFTNGQSSAVAKVALFNFINEQGLSKNGENEFAATADSGDAMFYRGADGKVFNPSKIKGSFLEQSNVDLGVELTHVIAFQKAYEASAKSITTADQMLKRAIEMKK